MRIALTMRVTEATEYVESRDSISHDWLTRLYAWNATPLLVPNIGAQAALCLDDLRADILILTGGDDIGRTPVRDATEKFLLDHALATGLPVLGVCRGMQMINTCLGGKLCPVEGHAAASHLVSFIEAWTALYGAEAEVNSYHETAIPADGVAPGLIITATDGDGHVEGFRHSDQRVAGVMWHPERKGSLEGDGLLVSELVREADASP